MKKFYALLSLAPALFISLSLIAQQPATPTVKYPVFSGKTKAIYDTRIVVPGPLHIKPVVPENPPPFLNVDFGKPAQDYLELENQQDFRGHKALRGPFLNVEGQPNFSGGWPADPNGDIGKDHYVQTVNSSIAVFDRQGEMIFGPVAYQSIFESFPGPWNEINWCDPVILYDHLADRWAFTTMSLNTNQGLMYEMVAVSVTPDPLGEYYCYAYQFENVNDYPKMSVWPNGYYLTYNIWTTDWKYLHSLVTVVDREAMLAGAPDAAMIEFQVEVPNGLTFRRTPLTADFNGSLLPGQEACPVVVPEFSITGFPWPVKVNMFAFLPDWSNPALSTFDSIAQFEVEGTYPMMGFGNAPQPGNFHGLEAIHFFPMYPLHYRNLGSYEVMAACHTLFDGIKFYIRWYELRREDAGWYLHQTGNYAPDSASRYVPSISVNGNGDIAMGFTKSSLEINPSIWLTGRRHDDDPGIMSYGEIELFRGLNYANNFGSQGRNRWGDYASMMVDPMDDTTFWFTSMYPLFNTNPGNWSTRIIALNLTDDPCSPYAWAGNDTVICGYEAFQLHASAENYSSMLWETRGDGTFSDKRKLNTIYVRGPQDLENGQVTLCLNLTGYEPGSCCADSMILFLNKLPEVEAGNDDTVCVNYSVSLQGSVDLAEEVYWTSSGGGAFNDATSLNAIYTPALSDTASEFVTLTLHAVPLYPCTDGKADSLRVFVEACLGLDDEAGTRFSMSVHPNPTTGILYLRARVEQGSSVMASIFDEKGKLLFTGQFKTGSDLLEKQFDLSEQPNGIYYFHVTNGLLIKTIKIIKSNN